MKHVLTLLWIWSFSQIQSIVRTYLHQRWLLKHSNKSSHIVNVHLKTDPGDLWLVNYHRIMLSMMTTIWLQISFGQFIHPILCSILPKSFYFPTFCIYIAEYGKKTKPYHSSGRSGLVQASQTLFTNVTNYIITAPEGISLDHGSISDLSELEPFHSDFYLTSVIPASSSVSSITDNESDVYIVERIEAKRFNSHKIQYEYNVKWLG